MNLRLRLAPISLSKFSYSVLVVVFVPSIVLVAIDHYLITKHFLAWFC